MTTTEGRQRITKHTTNDKRQKTQQRTTNSDQRETSTNKYRTTTITTLPLENNTQQTISINIQKTRTAATRQTQTT